MRYALLCYHDEAVVWSWSKEEDEAVMGRLHVIHERLEKQGKLGPAPACCPTTAATTLRKSDPPLVIDGPYAETRNMLGFYTLDVENLDEALAICREFAQANPGSAL